MMAAWMGRLAGDNCRSFDFRRRSTVAQEDTLCGKELPEEGAQCPTLEI